MKKNKFPTMYDFPKTQGQTFSKHRPKRKLKIEEDGEINLIFVTDPQTGEVMTEDVVAQVQAEKNKCVVLTETKDGLALPVTGNGYPVDLKERKKQGMYGDFRNAPKSHEELLDRLATAKAFAPLLGKDGSLDPSLIEIPAETKTPPVEEHKEGE